MTPKDNGSDSSNESNDIINNLIENMLRIDTWHKVVMFIVLSTWFALVWDFVANKASHTTGVFTTFSGANKRPVLFAEDLVFINELIKKYPDANISVIEISYLAGIASKPLSNLNTTDKVVILKSGIPIAAVLMSPDTPAEAKAEIQRYFKGNDNISPTIPLTPNAQPNPSTPLPSRSPLAIPRGN